MRDHLIDRHDGPSEADRLGYSPADVDGWQDTDPVSVQEALDRAAGGHCGVVFVGPTAPTNPGIGQLWLDTDDDSVGTDAIVTITGNTTLDDTHKVVLCDASGGGFTVTLPPAASHSGRIYHIVKIDTTGNVVTIDGNGSETINNQLTLEMSTFPISRSPQSDASNWWVR